MLQTLDARLAQARAGELGHLEFLQVLCHDEISRRETTSIARRTRRARFEETLTLEGFDLAAAPKLPAAQIRDLAALRWLQTGESVILYGPAVGVGKTHVAQALGPPRDPRRRRGPIRQDQPHARRTRPAGTPTAPGPAGYANSPDPPCSSWTYPDHAVIPTASLPAAESPAQGWLAAARLGIIPLRVGVDPLP